MASPERGHGHRSPPAGDGPTYRYLRAPAAAGYAPLGETREPEITPDRGMAGDEEDIAVSFPECVAQQKKFVTSRIMNCGDLIASLNVIPLVSPPFTVGALARSNAGGRRTRNEIGIMMAATIAATINSVVRQS